VANTGVKVAIVDGLCLVALALVLQDLAGRTAYAASSHYGAPPGGYVPSFSYSILMRTFTMSGGPLALVSPPTLDWVQLLALILVVANGWYFYGLWTKSKKKAAVTSSS